MRQALWGLLTRPTTLLGVAALFVALSVLSYVGIAIFNIAASQFTIKPVWGVVLALLILAGPRHALSIWLIAILSSLAVRFAAGGSLLQTFVATFVGLGSVWGILALLRRLQGPRPNFRDWLQLTEFFAVTLLVTLAVGTVYARIGSVLEQRDFLQMLQVWTLPTLLSFAIFTPLLVMAADVRRHDLARMKARLPAAAAAALLVTAFICSGRFPYYYPVPLVLLIVSLACDIEGALVALLVTVTSLTAATLAGYGPTRNALPFPTQLLFDQIFLLSLVFTLLPIAAAISERRRLHGELVAALKHKDALVAEQHLLYSAAVLLRDGAYSEALFRELAALLPEGWLHKECCQARIAYRDFVVTTPGWRETEWRQSAAFSTGRGSGVIEVVYLEARPAAAEGPFLTEERAMLNALAEMLVSYLEHEDLAQERHALEEQLRQAQRKEAMGTLAGGIAHDFNNLLAAVQGYASLIHDDLDAASPTRRFAERIAAVCDRGKEIVGQILTFARDGVQQQRMLGLCGFVRECEPLLSQAVASGAALTFAYPPNDVLVKGNSGQMLQLLANLCVNAGLSLGGGDGVIRVEIDLPSGGEIAAIATLPRDPGRHRIGVMDRQISYVRLRVSDNGAGIAPDVLRRIFDPFFTTRGRHDGAGLGLSVCHGIIESHDGFCLVETTPGYGTCFSVFLPALGQADAAASAPPVARRPASGCERVMLVDDEPDITDVTSIALQRLGYEVRPFNDPREALAAFRDDPHGFDIVIADLIMPRMYGLELLETLKALNPGIPTILCSGHAGDASSPAVDMHLTKPVPAAELNRCMRVLLAPGGGA